MIHVQCRPACGQPQMAPPILQVLAFLLNWRQKVAILKPQIVFFLGFQVNIEKCAMQTNMWSASYMAPPILQGVTLPTQSLVATWRQNVALTKLGANLYKFVKSTALDFIILGELTLAATLISIIPQGTCLCFVCQKHSEGSYEFTRVGRCYLINLQNLDYRAQPFHFQKNP